MEKPSFQEDHISQIPALILLQNMGYEYLTPEQALEQRGFDLNNVILDEVLRDQLTEINSFTYKGSTHKFSENTIEQAMNTLKDITFNEGQNVANEKTYDLLTLGKSFEQRVEGDKKSYTLKYIDWEHPENNVYHVTEEYEVQRVGMDKLYRPDIVLFVNGIPLVVIEAKRPDLYETESEERKPVNQAISQHLRNQNVKKGIPQLYVYSQLLLSIGVNDARYATSGTSMEYWSFWKEKDEDTDTYENEVKEIKNENLPEKDWNNLFSDRFKYIKEYFNDLYSKEVQITEQDKTIYSLCKPEILLDLSYRFIVFDAGIKKIARYQQYFAVKKTLERIKNKQGGKREGGVIWHTQGSGKSLTMVMIARALAVDKSITDHKVILVTDRVNLDDQLHDTFIDCGLASKDRPPRAKSGRDLLKRLKSSDTLITTVIDKFDSAVSIEDYVNESPDIFVLVDESHRSQYGKNNAIMQKMMPNACYIGLTGTPLMKKEKNTALKFGGFIDKYTINQAVDDGAVVPLVYEGRHVIQDVNNKPLDEYFELISSDLTEEQKSELKRKFAQADQLNKAEQKLYRIAWDISLHYSKEWKGTGFKAQVATDSKDSALKLKKYFDDIGKISTEVIISPPDMREGHEDVYEEAPTLVNAFWEKMMSKYGNEKEYNKKIIESFKNSEDAPEIIIVVDKLLTGFDAPVNTVLYITRNLREHTLLQAIARVNRVKEGKDFGYIIDYYGILGELDQALTTYSALEEFEQNDLEGTLTNVSEEIEKLPQYHADLWEIFKEIENKKDAEAYERLLADEELRQKFYKRLNNYAKTFKLALSTLDFIQTTDDKRVAEYKEDLKFFLNLRASVRTRYSEGIDYSKYEKQIQKLIDTHVGATEVVQLTEQVNILDKEKFEEELEKVTSTAGRADTIATRTAATIAEVVDENPAYYKKLSTMLQEVIDDYRQKRINEVTYLERAKEIADKVRNHPKKKYPDPIKENEDAQAYYEIIEETFSDVLRDSGTENYEYGEIAKEIDMVFKDNIIRDWKANSDVKKKMQQHIDDYLYDISKKSELPLSTQNRDIILNSAMKVALRRYKDYSYNESK